ncbi:MAG TPA: DUF2975 domain-containing protein [Opitutaceae bacterium]|nr:DUF2975 domain-containing protein [Opitutaceae bacterium]HUJ43105.1 DUF2975 domain-containing protein [Opitutaceae bacterium]
MKPYRLLSFFRSSCSFLEWIFALGAVFVLLYGWVFSPYLVSTPGLTWAFQIYQSKFDLQPPLNPIAYHGASPGTVLIQNLRADICVRLSGNPGALLNFVRLRSACGCLLMILACAISSQLRRLCDNVIQGEAFSLSSVQLIRVTGWCYFGYFVATSVVFNAVDWLIARDLRQHLTLERLQTDFNAADTSGAMNFSFGSQHLAFNLTTLWIALLAFVLAEIFRQGVLMKQENELTV